MFFFHENILPKQKQQQQTAKANRQMESQVELQVQEAEKKCIEFDQSEQIELRLLVRRREAGALIGRRGSNIKRLREKFSSALFTVPDSGNGPERVVSVTGERKQLDQILENLIQLLNDKTYGTSTKSPTTTNSQRQIAKSSLINNDEDEDQQQQQIELKLLVHCSLVGSLIGIGGAAIKKLRTVRI